MPRKRTYLVLLALLVSVLVAAGCAQPLPSGDSQATIDDAVQATLTAVAAATAAAETPAPKPVAVTTATPASRDAGALILPPVISNFNATARAENTKGDAEAPVVMYEWSDYT